MLPVGAQAARTAHCNDLGGEPGAAGVGLGHTAELDHLIGDRLAGVIDSGDFVAAGPVTREPMQAVGCCGYELAGILLR